MTAASHRRASHRLVAGACVLLAAGLLAGCSIGTDSSPRDIPDANRGAFINPSAQAVGSNAGSDRIYLLVPDATGETHVLRAATRNVGPSAQQRLTSLFGALTVSDTTARLRTAIPDGLQLLSATLQSNGTLVVDVTDQLLGLSTSTLTDAVAQIVFTASDVENVKRVTIDVDGKNRQWPASDGELQSAPLTIYDYPGFVESTQPDFPAVPSPGAGS